MKFDVAVQALGSTAWEWSEPGFAALATGLGLRREADADPEMPAYESPWGKELVQALIEDGAVMRVEFVVEETAPRWRPFATKKLVALRRKYRDKLAAYVKRASAVLGEPAFNGDNEASGLFEDDHGYAFALWRLATARLIVMARNEGRDTPFWISIVVKPLTASRPQTARPSRPVLRAHTRQSTSTMHGARFDATLDTIASMRWDWSAIDDAIVDKLALPAQRGDKRIEMVVELNAPPSDGFTDDDIEYLFTDYLEKFDAYVDRAERILREPKYNDAMGLKGCPKDERAERIALWQLKTARVMLLMTNEGATTPYAIRLVVKPR